MVYPSVHAISRVDFQGPFGMISQVNNEIGGSGVSRAGLESIYAKNRASRRADFDVVRPTH